MMQAGQRLGAIVVAGACVAAMACHRLQPLHVSFAQSTRQVEVYDFVEVTAGVSWPQAANPFTDAALSGWFETADGSRRWPVEGFCDAENGGVFRLRFMPPVAGDYRFDVEYRQGSGASRWSGSFQAADARRRGPIRVDANYPWHFVWEGTGEHYFFNGTTAYWLAGWTDEKVIAAALDRLHARKINRLRVTLSGRADKYYGEPVMVGQNWTFYVTPWPAKLAEDVYHPGFDYTRFYLPYWQKFERMVRLARDRDMVISVVLDMNDSRVHPAADSEDERRFLRYAVARLAAYSNVTWDLGDDLDLYRSDEWTHRTGTFLKGIDPYHHLATSHPVDNRHQDRTSDWFDFTSFQEWSRDQHAFMLRQRQQQMRLGRRIPLANEEYGYEDHYPPWSLGLGSESADTLRRTAWEIVMAGGYQTTGESARRGTNVWPDTGGGWINGRGDDSMTMLQGYAHMVDFFTSFDWWRTEPSDGLVEAGNECLAVPGELYAIYLPRGGRTTVRLGVDRFRAAWFNPITGAWTDLPEAQGPVWTSPAADSGQDWALLLRRK